MGCHRGRCLKFIQRKAKAGMVAKRPEIIENALRNALIQLSVKANGEVCLKVEMAAMPRKMTAKYWREPPAQMRLKPKGANKGSAMSRGPNDRRSDSGRRRVSWTKSSNKNTQPTKILARMSIHPNNRKVETGIMLVVSNRCSLCCLNRSSAPCPSRTRWTVLNCCPKSSWMGTFVAKRMTRKRDVAMIIPAKSLINKLEKRMCFVSEGFVFTEIGIQTDK